MFRRRDISHCTRDNRSGLDGKPSILLVHSRLDSSRYEVSSSISPYETIIADSNSPYTAYRRLQVHNCTSCLRVHLKRRKLIRSHQSVRGFIGNTTFPRTSEDRVLGNRFWEMLKGNGQEAIAFTSSIEKIRSYQILIVLHQAILRLLLFEILGKMPPGTGFVSSILSSYPFVTISLVHFLGSIFWCWAIREKTWLTIILVERWPRASPPRLHYVSPWGPIAQ